jgi:hypothetical protein
VRTCLTEYAAAGFYISPQFELNLTPIQPGCDNTMPPRNIYSASTQKVAIQNCDNIPIIGNENEMNFSKTAPANLPG